MMLGVGFQPEGRIELPSPKDASAKEYITHKEMAKSLGLKGSGEAFDEGWIRWYINNGELHMETDIPANERNVITLERGLKTLEKILQDTSKISHFIGKHSKQPIYIITYSIQMQHDIYYANSSRDLLIKIKNDLANRK